MTTTLNDLTRMMRNIEKIINWYNKKYNFQMNQASAKEQKEYNCLLERWDFLKAKRDSL